MFLSGTSERDSLGGFITWKQALKTIWICGLIGFGIGTLYQVVFMKYIEPELMEEQKEMQIKMMEGMRGKGVQPGFLGRILSRKKIRRMD